MLRTLHLERFADGTDVDEKQEQSVIIYVKLARLRGRGRCALMAAGAILLPVVRYRVTLKLVSAFSSVGKSMPGLLACMFGGFRGGATPFCYNTLY